MASAAVARLGLRASLLPRALSTSPRAPSELPRAVTTSTPPTADVPTANLLWLERELNHIKSAQLARLADLRRETMEMHAELRKAVAEHANAVEEFKFAAAKDSAHVVLVGGVFGFVVIYLHSD